MGSNGFTCTTTRSALLAFSVLCCCITRATLFAVPAIKWPVVADDAANDASAITVLLLGRNVSSALAWSLGGSTTIGCFFDTIVVLELGLVDVLVPGLGRLALSGIVAVATLLAGGLAGCDPDATAVVVVGGDCCWLVGGLGGVGGDGFMTTTLSLAGAGAGGIGAVSGFGVDCRSSSPAIFRAAGGWGCGTAVVRVGFSAGAGATRTVVKEKRRWANDLLLPLLLLLAPAAAAAAGGGLVVVVEFSTGDNDDFRPAIILARAASRRRDDDLLPLLPVLLLLLLFVMLIWLPGCCCCCTLSSTASTTWPEPASFSGGCGGKKLVVELVVLAMGDGLNRGGG